MNMNEFNDTIKDFKVLGNMNTLMHVLMQYKEDVEDLPHEIEEKCIVFALGGENEVLGESESPVTNSYENIMAGMLVPKVKSVLAVVGAYCIARESDIPEYKMKEIVEVQMSEVGPERERKIQSLAKDIGDNLERVIHCTLVDDDGAYAALIFREKVFSKLNKLRRMFKDVTPKDIEEAERLSEDLDYEFESDKSLTKQVSDMFGIVFNETEFIITEDRLKSLTHLEASLLRSMTKNATCLDYIPSFAQKKWIKEYPEAVAGIHTLASIIGIDPENLNNEEEVIKMQEVVRRYWTA